MKKQGELVRFTTQDVSKAIPITDSLIIAENLDYQHFRLTALIKKHLDDFEDFGAITFQKCLLNSKNVEVMLLNQGQFLLLITYLRATKKNQKVRDLKKQMVREFVLMRNELNARIETRHIGKVARFSLTDSIKNNVGESGRFKSYAYGNYTKIIYKKVLGMTVKKFKEKHDIPKDDNIRDYLSIKTLQEVQELESKVATIIEFSKCKNNKEVYAEIKTYLNNYSLLA